MPSQEEINNKVLDLDRTFSVLKAIALFFGITGSIVIYFLKMGYKEVSELKKEIAKERLEMEALSSEVENTAGLFHLEKQKISEAVDLEILNLAPRVKEMAREEVSKIDIPRYMSNTESENISKLGYHNSINIEVEEGDVIFVVYSGSAKNSEFYFRIIDRSMKLESNGQNVALIQNSKQSWEPIVCHQMFKATESGTAIICAELFKNDVRGNVKVLRSSLSVIVL